MSTSEKRRVRYAVIGLGNIAQVAVLPAFEHAKENSELVALISSDPDKPRIFSSVFCHQVREGDIRTKEERGGGALFDMGIYCLNAARYIFQDEPIEVYAEQVVGTDSRFRGVDEMTTAVLRFPRDRVAQLTASQGAADVSEFRVVGTKGDIRLDPAYDYAGELNATVTIDGKEKTMTASKRDQFAPEIVHFSRCILEGSEPEPSGREGLADVRIMQAMVRSAETGARITLSPVAQSARPNADLEMKKPPTKKVKPVNAPSPSK